MSDSSSRPPSGLHHVEMVMGMAVSIDIRDTAIQLDVIDDVVAWLHHVDDEFSPYKESSPVTALGRGELSLDDASADLREVLRQCESLRLDTGGIFDAFEVPAPNGTRFDPSGFVKGWSIERSAEILERQGCTNFCINAGGDIAVRGEPAPGTAWRIGVRHPTLPDAFAVVLEVTGNVAVATSALYERGAHIIDPRTGEPSTGLASATVVGPDLALADGYATAVFIMGHDGLRWVDEHPGYDAYIITNDGETAWTPGFASYRAAA